MQAFKSRKLPTTGQWRAEAKRFLHLPEHSDTPDSFVPFASAEDVGSSASCSDHDSDYDLKPERPVYADSIHQSFGRSRGTRIVFNNLAQADNVGAALAGQSSLNRNRVCTLPGDVCSPCDLADCRSSTLQLSRPSTSAAMVLPGSLK